MHGLGIRCLTVSANGGVTVSWDQAGVNIADFRVYYLYHSTSAAGPFTAIDSVFFSILQVAVTLQQLQIVILHITTFLLNLITEIRISTVMLHAQ